MTSVSQDWLGLMGLDRPGYLYLTKDHISSSLASEVLMALWGPVVDLEFAVGRATYTVVVQYLTTEAP